MQGGVGGGGWGAGRIVVVVVVVGVGVVVLGGRGIYIPPLSPSQFCSQNS